MVRIRLRRVGRKHRPIYRVVVADSRSPRDGAFIETIGHYDPLTEPATVVVNEERALKWLRDGAQPTDTVSSLLRRLGILDRFKQGSQSKSDS
jgi:small subunit ribosomal protein S16